MSDRQHVHSGAPWESIAGYSRAVRVGDQIEVSGTTAAGPDAASQTRAIFRIIEAALLELGASLDDVVRTRMYVTHIERDWRSVAEVHGEVLGDVRPATAMVEVSRLVEPEMLVEIEAVARVG